MVILVREAEIEDAASLATCVDHVAKERRFLACTNGFSVEQTRSYIEFIQRNGGVYFVALHGSKVIGWCDISPLHYEGMTHAGRLGMGLLPLYRERGTGRKLISCALHKVFGLGLERIELEVFKSNEKAIGFYKRMGFCEEGCKRSARNLDGRIDDILILGLLPGEFKDPCDPGDEA